MYYASRSLIYPSAVVTFVVDVVEAAEEGSPHAAGRGLQSRYRGQRLRGREVRDSARCVLQTRIATTAERAAQAEPLSSIGLVTRDPGSAASPVVSQRHPRDSHATALTEKADTVLAGQ